MSAGRRPAGDTPAPEGIAGDRNSPRAWELKDLVLTVALGTVFAFVYYGLVLLWRWLGPAGDFLQHVMFGFWLIVAPITIAIVRRAGSGVIAEFLTSVVQVVFLGTATGPMLLISATIQGIGSEIPFAARRYRSYGWLTYALSGGLGAGLVFFWSAFRQGWFGQDVFIARLVVQVASGVVIGGLLAKVIVDALLRTGVLDDFAIGRARAPLQAAGGGE